MEGPSGEPLGPSARVEQPQEQARDDVDVSGQSQERGWPRDDAEKQATKVRINVVIEEVVHDGWIQTANEWVRVHHFGGISSLPVRVRESDLKTKRNQTLHG